MHVPCWTWDLQDLKRKHNLTHLYTPMKKIVYCLTSRGLYSELSNLAMAHLYAQQHGYDLEVNTRNWNARLKAGLTDYFLPSYKESHSLLTLQDKIYTREKTWFGKIYYNPSEFWRYWTLWTLNHLYTLLHPSTLLSKEVYARMTSQEFLAHFTDEELASHLSDSFRSFYRYNKEVQDEIQRRKDRLSLNAPYIALHVRRGDKITSGEMQDLALETYIHHLRDKLDISRHIYIATDDVDVITYFEARLSDTDVQLYYNTENNQKGFDEKTFNAKGVNAVRDDMLNMLFDMEMLIHASYFIGTYSSNIGRIIPLYLGFDKCHSVDEPWNVTYR